MKISTTKKIRSKVRRQKRNWGKYFNSYQRQRANIQKKNVHKMSDYSSQKIKNKQLLKE